MNEKHILRLGYGVLVWMVLLTILYYIGDETSMSLFESLFVLGSFYITGYIALYILERLGKGKEEDVKRKR